MNRNIVFLSLSLVVAAVTIAHSGPANATQAARNRQAGRFALSSAGDSAVMLDTESGDSWYLEVKNPDRPTWVAIKRQQGGQERGAAKAAGDMERRLLETELALAKLKDAFGPRHPRVLEKQREVEMIKKMLSGNR
jgi:hypothetical protein